MSRFSRGLWSIARQSRRRTRGQIAQPQTRQMSTLKLSADGKVYTQTPYAGVPENVYPILLLPSCWHKATYFASLMDQLAARGFHSSALSFQFKDSDGLRECVDYVSGIASKMYPPIIVAHSWGAFLAQKYLESYAASAVVFLCPFPPEPAIQLPHLKSQPYWSPEKPNWRPQTILDTMWLCGDNLIEPKHHEYQRTMAYYLDSISSAMETLPRKALEQTVDPTFKVNLEPFSVPMLVVGGGSDRVIGPEQLSMLAEYHGVPEEDCHLIENLIRNHNSVTQGEHSYEVRETAGEAPSKHTRNATRDSESGTGRNIDRNMRRGVERNLERKVERNMERNPEINTERNPGIVTERNALGGTKGHTEGTTERTKEKNSASNTKRDAEQNKETEGDMETVTEADLAMIVREQGSAGGHYFIARQQGADVVASLIERWTDASL